MDQTLKRICVIYNFAQHYRSGIFTLMDKELCCDFVFGDEMDDVKKMDYTLLKHFKKEVKNKKFIVNSLYYQSDTLSLLDEEYDIYLVFGNLKCISTWFFLLKSKLYRNKKIYLWSHGWYGKEGLIKTILKKCFFNLSDGTFLYGNYAKNLMIQEGVNESKLFVIHNSLLYDKQIEIRKTLTDSLIYTNHFGNNFPNLFFVGRLTLVKHLDMIVFALNKLKSNNSNFNLTFIGEGETKEELLKLVIDLQLQDRVWFYGACYDEVVLSELIYNASLCIAPGNVGLTALHSMVYGTPVLTHNNFIMQMPEFEAIIDGKTGIFFEYNSTDSLAKSIEKWFSTLQNREAIRQNCYNEIDSLWNPYFQLKVLKEHLI